MTRILIGLAALALSLAPQAASAQVRIVVEGSFELGSPYTPAPAAPLPAVPAVAPVPVIAPVAVTVAPAVEVVPEAPPAVEPEHRSPRWRLDFGAPGVGVGGFYAPSASYERFIMSASFDARLVGSHGHGAMVRYTSAGNIWGTGHGFEADYVYRARLAGDDRVGLGLDVMAGLTLAELSHNEATVPHGFTPGGNVSLQLDLRLWGFVLSGAVVYRALVPTEGAPNGGPTGWEHAVTGTLGLGFGFWGY